MADISKFGPMSHFRGTPTGYAVHTKDGNRVHEGTGLSFWFRPLSAVLSEVPVDDRELPMLFHARTADFQDVAVQATITYRFADPVLVAQRLDFSIEPARGTWRSSPLEQVANLLTELAQQHALDLLTSTPVATVLSDGVRMVRDRITEGLADDPRLRDTAIIVLGVRVVAIRPEPDLERALQTPARERVQQEADKATYERRALAVERERAISENELQSKIELAVRQEQLVRQEGANERRRATEAAASSRIVAESKAENRRLVAAADAEAVRASGAAEADVARQRGAVDTENARLRGTADVEVARLAGAADVEKEAAKMAIYAALDPKIITALALREAAGHLPEIGSLTLSPDVVSAALARLAGNEG